MNNLSQAFSFQTFLKLDFQFDEPLLKDQNKEKPEIHSQRYLQTIDLIVAYLQKNEEILLRLIQIVVLLWQLNFWWVTFPNILQWYCYILLKV